MEEGIKQLALVSSVLGGFSFTFLSAILLYNTNKKIKLWLIIGFMMASMCFLLSAVGWSMIGLNDLTESTLSHHQSLVKLLLLGLIAIILTIGLSGWLDSQKSGIVTLSIRFWPCFSFFSAFWTDISFGNFDSTSWKGCGLKIEEGDFLNWHHGFDPRLSPNKILFQVSIPGIRWGVDWGSIPHKLNTRYGSSRVFSSEFQVIAWLTLPLWIFTSIINFVVLWSPATSLG